MILAALAMAASPSFDCAKAATHVEKMICGDQRLSRLDQAVAILYRTAVARRIKFDRSQSQRKWLEERNDCSDEGCLVDSYEWRVSELLGLTGSGHSYSSGPNQDLSVMSLGGGWYAFSATGIWVGSVERGQVNDAEASGVFQLVNGRGERLPRSDYEPGWRLTKISRGWRLQCLPEVTRCGGVNAVIDGDYR